jgi:hypothetical protein
LIERGFDAIGYEEISTALRWLRYPRTPKPQIIVLELRGQSLTPKELERLKQLGIPVVALGGALELNAPLIRGFEWAALLKRPFRIGDVVDLIQQLVEKVED